MTKTFKFLLVAVCLIGIQFVTSMTVGREQLLKRLVSEDTDLVLGDMPPTNVAIIYCNCGEAIPRELWAEQGHYFDFQEIPELDKETRSWLIDLAKEKWKLSSIKIVDQKSERDEAHKIVDTITYDICIDQGVPFIAHSMSQVGSVGYTSISESSFVWVFFTWIKISNRLH